MEQPIYHFPGVLPETKGDAVQRDFHGPLDLILHLLGQKKLDICDVSLTSLTEQYLDWVQKRQANDLEVASEFLAMASHLLYLKSRMLLTREDREALEALEALAASLEERRSSLRFAALQTVLPALRNAYGAWGGVLTRAPLPFAPAKPRYVHQPDELSAALLRMQRKYRRKLPPAPQLFSPIAGREPYPVEEKSRETLSLLRRCGALPLSRLLSDSRDRSELVAVFLSVLELCRQGELTLYRGALGQVFLCPPGAQPPSASHEEDILP